MWLTGLIRKQGGVRYDYLWNDEKLAGRAEGAKVRPCAVVLVRTINQQGRLAVMLVPITHSPPSHPANAIEIPETVKLTWVWMISDHGSS